MYSELGDKKRGVLNDFDLASVMEPGSRFPEKTGWERSGSIPFMAEALIEFPDGMVKRWYRYDFESFAWCLLWHTLVTPSPDWPLEDLGSVLKFKTAITSSSFECFFLAKARLEWRMYIGVIFEWFRRLDEMRMKIRDSAYSKFRWSQKIFTNTEKALIYDELDDKIEDKEHIRPIILAAKSMEEGQGFEVLDNITWIDITIEKRKTVK